MHIDTGGSAGLAGAPVFFSCAVAVDPTNATQISSHRNAFMPGSLFVGCGARRINSAPR
jgi:hypothetical protein